MNEENSTFDESINDRVVGTTPVKPGRGQYQRKSVRGLRVSGHLTVPASREVEKFRQEYGSRVTEILSTAMIWYARYMRGELTTVRGNPLVAVSAANQGSGRPKKIESPTATALNVAKALWCEEYGGTVEGNLCMFDKFEVTLAGRTESSKRTVALVEMPDDKDQFRNFILGGYANVYEARRAVAEGE